MTYHPHDPANRPTGDPTHHPANIDPVPRSNRLGHDVGTTTWIIGAVALFAAIGILFWAISYQPTNVAGTGTPAGTTTQQGPPGPAQAPPTVPQRNPDTNVGQTAPASRR